MRNYFKVLFIVLICLSLIHNILNAKKNDPLKDTYKKWLDDAHYLITKTERNVFHKLNTNKERDVFIKAFWKHRDFTRNTPENEYKNEHYKRLKYVKTKYGRGKTRIGWKTDRGKVYIILGKPLSIQRFAGFTSVKEAEVWNYQQKPRAGIPPVFNIIFFDKSNTGEMVLYSPTIDGPQGLLLNFQAKPGDYTEAYAKVKEYNAFLADTSISLIPGEQSAVGKPSMSSDFLLRNIYQAPKKNVDDFYAKQYLNYKGTVNVDYSINYIKNKSSSFIIKDKNGINFLHYIIELKTLSLDQYENKFYTKIEVYANLTDLSGKNIYQYQKNFNVSLDPQQFKDLENSSFAISDHFPVNPGKYKLSVMLKNTNSKEFSVYDTKLNINSKNSNISRPILAYKINRGITEKKSRPFKTEKGNLIVDPENKFTKSNKLYTFFQLTRLSEKLRNSGKIILDFKGDRSSYTKRITKSLKDYSSKEKNFLFETDLKDFPIDYYKISVSVQNSKGQAVLDQKNSFFITPKAKTTRPQTYSKSSSIKQDALTSYTLALQYLNINKPLKALPLMKKAHFLSPRIKQFVFGLSNLYYILKTYDKIEPLLKPFINFEKPDYQMFIILGNVNKKMKKWSNAILYYKKLMNYQGLIPDVLNSMATCYFNLNNIEEAKKAWKRSLELDPKQKKVKKIISSLK